MQAATRTRYRALALLAGLVLLSGARCSVLGLDGYGDERERLAANRSQWQKQGIDSYAFVLQRIRFCGGGTSPATVVVRNHQRISVTDVATGQPVPAEVTQYYLTVNELFAFIEDAINRAAYKIDVTYDATYGFPRSVAIDYQQNVADEEMAFEAKSFQPQR